jgi:hypothetical protein
MLGAVALGHPADTGPVQPAKPPRKPLDRVAEFLE